MKNIEVLAFRFSPTKSFFILDQTLLPEKKKFISINHPRQMSKAIKDMKVRGANLIGITAAFSLAQYTYKNPKAKDILSLARELKESRPTAVHLAKAVDKVLKKKSPLGKLKQALSIYESDRKACDLMAQKAQSLLSKGEGILTYCNTGSLATGGIGTALGVIKKAFKKKKDLHVYVCETRPCNQGSRLTFWELKQENIACTLICDNMLAYLISQKKIHKAFVGADCISLNGDTANKIGTYNMAVICKHFKIPFYVVAPFHSIDASLKKGFSIPIELRPSKELSFYWSQKGADIWNPSFDVTPHKLITGILTEKGFFKSPIKI
ncbi:MAG: S-methyl-5-thioribose-1-phosphate isomerase [Bdellovibrionales bacterium]|nr:S-methyl-5-thioribose-1-phosphate isomerase [Bdellovibrionales bacterium]